MRRKKIQNLSTADLCLLSSSKCISRKLSYRKDDHAMCPENFRGSLGTPTATIF